MAGKTLFGRNSEWKSPVASSSSSSSSASSSLTSPLLNRVVFLHEWWLIKTNSNTHLGVGGISQEKQAIRSFVSGTIVKRVDAVTVKTVDGITIMVHGLLNKSRTLENGFSHKVCDHFICGFPYDWEDYAALSSDKHAKSTEDHGSSMNLMHKLFDDILKHGSDSLKCAKNETSPRIRPIVSTSDEFTANHTRKRHKRYVNNVKCSGPLTRSRARLLDI